MAKGATSRSGGFGAAVASVARDIGRALGFDRSSARGAGGTTRSIGGDIRQSMMSPGERQLAAMQERRSNRDDRPAAASVAAVAPPAAVAQPVQPGTAAPTDGTLMPPAAPLPVVPGDMGSTGAAEDAALASARQGRAATIATGAQGLLAENADQLRRRRSLVGGGLIA